jgi:signal peptidase I
MTPRDVPGLLLRGAAAYVLVVSVAILLAVGVLPRTGWYRTLTVLSGSMRPTFAPGDMVVAAPKPAADLQVGDVLVYSIPIGDHHVESHRVVKILGRNPLEVVTKGDANTSADPWTAQLSGDQVWTVSTDVPRVGQAILWLRSPRVHQLSIYVFPAIVAFLLLNSIWGRRPEEELLPDANVVRSA